jgi:hypothetical protein
VPFYQLIIYDKRNTTLILWMFSKVIAAIALKAIMLFSPYAGLIQVAKPLRGLAPN